MKLSKKIIAVKNGVEVRYPCLGTGFESHCYGFAASKVLEALGLNLAFPEANGKSDIIAILQKMYEENVFSRKTPFLDIAGVRETQSPSFEIKIETILHAVQSGQEFAFPEHYPDTFICDFMVSPKCAHAIGIVNNVLIDSLSDPPTIEGDVQTVGSRLCQHIVLFWEFIKKRDNHVLENIMIQIIAYSKDGEKNHDTERKRKRTELDT